MDKVIEYNLLPKQRRRKNNMFVKIDIYDYALELFEELEKIKIIDKLKITPQLGVIKVDQKLTKTRYDYVMLQLHLHQLVKKNLQMCMRYTYNNLVKEADILENIEIEDKKEYPTVGDVLQLLTITYNIGHFFNTFTASRAVIMLSTQDEKYKDMIINASEDVKYIECAKKILEENNYHRLHLLNTLLILEKCNKESNAIKLAKNIIFEYINEDRLDSNGKIKYIFEVFRKIRNVSYISFDLQTSNTPVIIDLSNEDAMKSLLKEFLSEYNNKTAVVSMINSISKLLDNKVYNEKTNVICYYNISKNMANIFRKHTEESIVNYFEDVIEDKYDVFNKLYYQRKDYDTECLLKLTFNNEEENILKDVFIKIDKINNTRIGYYDRYSGEKTIVVAIKKSCDCQQKKIAAFKVLRSIATTLKNDNRISIYDKRYLLTVKFMLYYLFDKNPVVIKPTLDREICTVCTRGHKSRLNEINKIIEKYYKDDTQKHETIVMKECLKADSKNDTSICIPASVVVYHKDKVGKKLCEFDGMIIHIMRKTEQVVFIEAKQISRKPSTARNCLVEKFNKISLDYDVNKIRTIGYDAIMQYTL